MKLVDDDNDSYYHNNNTYYNYYGNNNYKLKNYVKNYHNSNRK